MRTSYEPTMTMRDAVKRYFEVNGFGANGGYDEAWVDFKLGPIPMPFPNTPARVRAVKFHDLHHILTDYDTDVRGEFEISAWEIAAGCGSFLAAWQLNLGGLAGGLFSAPIRVFRAFVRGRHTDTFYGREYDALLGLTVAEARRLARTDGPPPRATMADVAMFGLASVAGLVVGLATFALIVPILPFALVGLNLRKRQAASA